MTEPTRPTRTPYPSPGQVPPSPKRRPSDERAALAASSRTATRLAIVAIVVAGIGLGLAVWRTVMPVSGSSCQNTAWSAQPAANELPDQWTVKGTTFDVNRRTTQFAGVDSGSGTGAPNVLATVTCFPEGAADAMSRAVAAAREIGQTVTDKGDLSDGGFEATDLSGASFLEFRRGDILVDLAASGGATTADIETVASAYDRALGGDGGAISSQAPSASGDLGQASPGPSDDASAGASAAPAAPELEKLLPAKVGSVDLTVDSQLGSDLLQDDQGSRAIAAALRAAGKKPEDLRTAQAYDPNQSSPLNLLAVKVDGMDIAKVRQMVIDSWLAGSGAGVTQTPTTLSGKDYTKVDLGDGGAVDYVRTKDGVVFVVNTPDPAQAAQAAALLP